MTRVLLCIALTLPAQALACGMKIPKHLALTQVMEKVQEEAPEEAAENTVVAADQATEERGSPEIAPQTDASPTPNDASSTDQVPADDSEPSRAEPSQS